MTNKLLILAAAGTLALASCQGDVRTTGTDEEMQAKIDSAVQGRMEEMQAQLAAQNDSLINAHAMMRADSMMAASAAAGNNNTGMRRTVPTRPNTTANTTPAPPTTPRTDKENNLDRMRGSDNGTPAQATKEETAEKKSKLDRMRGN